MPPTNYGNCRANMVSGSHTGRPRGSSMNLLQLIPWLVFARILKLSLAYVSDDSSRGALHHCRGVYLDGGTSVDRKSAFIGGSVLGARQKGTTWIQGVKRKANGVGRCTMALKYKLRKPRNIRGDFFVDESCVDCDICRWMDPRTFTRSGLGSIVSSQPKTEEERMATFKAMLACPTGSIRTMRPDKKVIDALASFPLAVDEERLPNIYQLAPTTKESLGNTAYLIVRPGKGNVMIDVPRFLKRTAAKIEALGGVKYLIVTARNNAIGHEPWKAKFPGMIRILHRFELERKTRIMEERLDGSGPWYLVEEGKESDEAGYVTGDTARFDFVSLPEEERAPKDPTVKIVGLPGQTRGSVGVVLETERTDGVMERVAFTGGTVGFSSYLKILDTFPRTVETDGQTVASSVRRLAEEGITSLLPGRGARLFFDSPEEARAQLRDAADEASTFPDFLSNPMLVNPRF